MQNRPPGWVITRADGPLKTFYAVYTAESANLPALSPSTTTAATIAAATTAAFATTTAITATAAALGLWPSFVYVKRTAIEFRAVEMGNGCLRSLRIGHFDERETTGLPGVTIRNDIYTLHTAILGECGMQVILRCLITEVSDKYVGHSFGSFE
jgi:hypothetical protein